MKKTLLTILATITIIGASAQHTASDSTKKSYKNVIGLDATGLLRQFLNLNTYNYYYYPYVLTYKRFYNNTNAIRINLGGSTYSNNSTTNDTLQSTNNRNELFSGIGWEHYSYLSKRWNLYFGADIIYNYSNYIQKSSTPLSNSSEYTQTKHSYGVSPLLGVQFMINSRISVATETSYDIAYINSSSGQLHMPNSQNNRSTKTNGVETQFHAPTGLIFRVLF